jgi:hypothetical protein
MSCRLLTKLFKRKCHGKVDNFRDTWRVTSDFSKVNLLDNGLRTVGCTVLQMGGGEGEHYLHRELASGLLEITIVPPTAEWAV